MFNVILGVMGFAAWVTHIVICVKAAAYTGSAIAVLILGLVLFPIGVVHGFLSWFGFSWF